jgi:predicted RND superfamily exporter protein
VDFAGRRPLVTVLFAIMLFVGTALYARQLEPRTDLLELLPRDSPGFKAFEHQLGRVGGGATLLVICESPDRGANERFIDDLSSRLDREQKESKACHTACQNDAGCHAKCGPISSPTSRPAPRTSAASSTSTSGSTPTSKTSRTRTTRSTSRSAIRSGLVSDFSDDDEKPKTAPAPAPPTAPGAAAANAPPSPPADPGAPQKKSALGMDEYRQRWQNKAKKTDDFPTGYFATEDGRMHGIRVISTGTGLGDRSGDALMTHVRQVIDDLKPASYHPNLTYGFAGDIPNAIEEKESLMSDAAWATGIAVVLILGGVVVFFRSAWSLVVIGVPAFLGVTCAYAFAMWKFGYVNTAGAFLGAIIIGNGTNYPTVLLSRYREFRARGMPPDEARRDAVINAFRAELVGALVAGIAYGSLTITRFRGFSQFGTIGFVGMLFVWLTMIPVVPALIVIIEWVQSKLPPWLRRSAAREIAKDGSRGPVIAPDRQRDRARRPRAFLAGALVLSCVAA